MSSALCRCRTSVPLADYTDGTAGDVVLNQLITHALCLSRFRAHSCRSGALGEIPVLEPDFLIGAGRQLGGFD